MGRLVAFKVAEMMVDLVALGYPPVSRFGFWARPPAEETREPRQWFREHDSAFKYNPRPYALIGWKQAGTTGVPSSYRTSFVLPG